MHPTKFDEKKYEQKIFYLWKKSYQNSTFIEKKLDNVFIRKKNIIKAIFHNIFFFNFNFKKGNHVPKLINTFQTLIFHLYINLNHKTHLNFLTKTKAKYSHDSHALNNTS